MKPLFLFCLLCASSGLFAQLQLTGADVTIDFDNTVLGVNNGQFTALGFNAAPATGQLDSDGIIISGLADGDLTFGASGVGGGYALGTTAGNMTTAGVYALTFVPGVPFSSYTNLSANASGNLLAIQPDAGNFAPGAVTIRAQNATAAPISSLTVSADFCLRNDAGPNSATYTLAYSVDNVNYTTFYTNTSPEATGGQFPSYGCLGSGPGMISGVDVLPGEFIYVRFSGSAGLASGDFDEVAIDNITFSSIVLPVEFIHFGAESRDQRGVALDWATAWEQNSDYFEVQRSEDGRTFTGLDEVSAAGFANGETTYSYVDKTAPLGVSYYRLRQVDFDGSETYSEVVSVVRRINGQDEPITVAPNPTTDFVQVRSAVPFAADTQIQLLAADGRLLEQYTAGARTQLEVNLSGLPAGTYHLRMIDARRVQHFAVQKR